MSHDPRTRPASPVRPGAPAAEAGLLRRRSAEAMLLRRRGMIWAGVFLPAVPLAAVAALTSENAGRCVAYGNGCGSVTGLFALVALGMVLVALVTVQSTSRAAVRRAAYRVQLGAEFVFLTLVMTAFG
ncbi:hypothetical protein ACWD5B_33495 [Streptomyces tanashiensis]|uniref:hypothetical protein n=1 Tax=Streptomyces tanashiensis TaxID=67367 RepID=UPI0016785025|nr:hypothetical protein [Streptomyces tanashiensis]